MLCDRTREWVALSLDGELSEFESALMTAHLERCEPCRVFQVELGAITAELRSRPLETLRRPIELPARRRFVPARHVQIAAAAALVVGAAALAIGAIVVPQVGLTSSPLAAVEVRQASWLAVSGLYS
ncbi:MAG: zf-HC2 domain-containing protein, partial [Gaiellaceae bacterium]